MSGFKDVVAADNGQVFINGDEFADIHTINGVDVLCIMEGLTTEEMLTKANATPSYDGINSTTRILHVKTENMPERVVYGNAIEVDGEMYRVGDVVEDMGISTITLEADSL